MSYDQYIVPAEFCGDPESARRHASEQWELPGTDTAEQVADRITAQDPATEEAGILSVSPITASGDCVIVPSPFPRVDQARAVVFREALAAGFGIYDPQLTAVFDPKELLDGELISSAEGTFPAISPSVADVLIGRLRVEDFLIVERGDEIYVQTKRVEAQSTNGSSDATARGGVGAYLIEYRDGSSDQHFGAEMSSSDDVAAAVRRWLTGGPDALRDGPEAAVDWRRLDLG